MAETASGASLAPVHASRRLQRGFTLIELLIALTAGLFVAMAAFVLARNSSQLFQREARLSAAQYSAMIGMARLQADLQRASYLTLPNTDNHEYRLAGDKTGWLAGMLQLSGITILDSDSTHAQNSVNGLTPDALILAGSFSASEKLGVRTIVGTAVYLQTDDSAMARTLAAAARGAPGLAEIFADGRIVRIEDDMGWSTYGVVATNGYNGNASLPIVTLDASPALAQRETAGHGGVHGLASSKYTINPVTRVRYDVRTVQGNNTDYPQYKHLFSAPTHAASGRHVGPAAAARHELVRVELDKNDSEIHSTLEILAEYAIDLKFGLTAVTDATTTPPTLTRYPIGDSNVYTIAAPINTGGGTPETIRAVQVRLAVRAAERDRDVPAVAAAAGGGTSAPPGPPGGGLYRFQFGNDVDDESLGFARVRTVVTDVALPNIHEP